MVLILESAQPCRGDAAPSGAMRAVRSLAEALRLFAALKRRKSASGAILLTPSRRLHIDNDARVWTMPPGTPEAEGQMEVVIVNNRPRTVKPRAQWKGYKR